MVQSREPLHALDELFKLLLGTGDCPLERGELAAVDGVGGDLVGCDNCISSYCEDCITRNLGKRTLAKIKKNNDWHCFSCDGSPVAELRWEPEPVRVPCGRALGQLG